MSLGIRSYNISIGLVYNAHKSRLSIHFKMTPSCSHIEITQPSSIPTYLPFILACCTVAFTPASSCIYSSGFLGGKSALVPATGDLRRLHASCSTVCLLEMTAKPPPSWEGAGGEGGRGVEGGGWSGFTWLCIGTTNNIAPGLHM